MAHAFLRLGVILSCAALGAGAASAQAKPVADDTLKLASIRRLLTLQRTDSVLLASIRQGMADQPADPEMPAGFMDSLMARAEREVGDFVERLVPVYDSLYSAGEIDELMVFFQSRLGRRLLETQLALAQATTIVGEQWGMELAAKVLLDFSKRPPPRKP